MPGTSPPGRASRQLSELAGGRTCALSVCPGGAWRGVAVSRPQAPRFGKPRSGSFVLRRSPSPTASMRWLSVVGFWPLGLRPVPIQGVLGEHLALPWSRLCLPVWAAAAVQPPCGMASDQAGSPSIPRGLKADSPSCPSSSKGWPCREPAPSPEASSRGWRCQYTGGVEMAQAATDASRTTWELPGATEPVPGRGQADCVLSGWKNQWLPR